MFLIEVVFSVDRVNGMLVVFVVFVFVVFFLVCISWVKLVGVIVNGRVDGLLRIVDEVLIVFMLCRIDGLNLMFLNVCCVWVSEIFCLVVLFV